MYELEIAFIQRLLSLGYCYVNKDNNVFIQLNKVKYRDNMWQNPNGSFDNYVASWASVCWKILLEDNRTNGTNGNNLIIWQSSKNGGSSPWGNGFPINTPSDLRTNINLN